MKEFNYSYEIFKLQNEISKKYNAEIPDDKLYWKSCKHGMPESGLFILTYQKGDSQVVPAETLDDKGECYSFGGLFYLTENDFYAYMPNPPERCDAE